MTESKPWRTRGVADISAYEIRERIAAGQIGPGDVADAFIERVVEREPEIRAFAYFDEEMFRAQTEAAVRRHGSGQAPGALNGIPVAVKDIVDTADMPTENGTQLDSGRRPKKDATIVSRLRAAGAVIAGKTVTTELAYLHPGRTRNPRDASRTPGGSSSGSAAAVAAGFAPLAVGTQTNGSVIRPASFCGVFGFKPTHGLIPRTGVLLLSRPLDTVGLFGRSVEDVAMLGDVLAGFDGSDPDTGLVAAPDLLTIASDEPPVSPDIAFVGTHLWDKAADETKAGFEELVAALGDRCKRLDIAKSFGEVGKLHRTLMTAGMARHLSVHAARGSDALSPEMREALDEGRRVTAVEYLEAQELREGYHTALDEVFNRYDAIITPAAPGEAPEGLESTGDASFCTMWSFCGVPAISLPLLEGPNGLPVGVQMIGRRGNDARLLRTARWLVNFVESRSGSADAT
jgi:Asp-tRNA(Asn)/Glu-tRNA(Gln) amidotransferase A subunit family amidase